MGERSQEYREGRVDQRLNGFDEHLATINGSIDATAHGLQSLKEEVVGQRRDIADIAVAVKEIMPKVQQLVAEGIGTKQVAEALDRRKETDISGSQLWRSKIAWAIGLLLTTTLILLSLRNLIGF